MYTHIFFFYSTFWFHKTFVVPVVMMAVVDATAAVCTDGGVVDATVAVCTDAALSVPCVG